MTDTKDTKDTKDKFDLSQDLYELNKKLNECKSVQEMLGVIESFKFYLMTQLKHDKGSSNGWLTKLGDNIMGYLKS